MPTSHLASRLLSVPRARARLGQDLGLGGGEVPFGPRGPSLQRRCGGRHRFREPRICPFRGGRREIVVTAGASRALSLEFQ